MYQKTCFKMYGGEGVVNPGINNNIPYNRGCRYMRIWQYYTYFEVYKLDGQI